MHVLRTGTFFCVTITHDEAPRTATEVKLLSFTALNAYSTQHHPTGQHLKKNHHTQLRCQPHHLHRHVLTDLKQAAFRREDRDVSVIPIARHDAAILGISNANLFCPHVEQDRSARQKYTTHTNSKSKTKIEVHRNVVRNIFESQSKASFEFLAAFRRKLAPSKYSYSSSRSNEV